MEKLVMGISEKPTKKGLWFLLSLQHVFAMFGATILVPFLTGLPVSVALFSSGAGTLIYIACTKGKVPVYLGSSFAYIGVVASLSGFGGLGTVNYGSAMTGLLMVGLIYTLISILVRCFGKAWINKLLPPVIIGPAIVIIGLGLASNAVNNSGLLSNASFTENWKVILTAASAITTVVFVAIYTKGFFKIIPFLVGIVVGFIVASLVGLVDFKAFTEVVMDPTKWIRIPEFMVLGWKNDSANFLGTTFTMNKVSFAGVITVAPLAFVTACEHIGDHSVLGKICGQDFLQEPGLDKTILGDGLATGFAALIGGPANTTYGENTSVIGMTKVASVYVTGLAACIAIVLSFFNVFTTFIELIPGSVMGGMSIILYGFIGLNGIKVIVDSKVDLSKTTNLVIISVMLVLGLGGAKLNFGDVTITSTAIAVIAGVVLNSIFNATGAKEEETQE